MRKAWMRLATIVLTLVVAVSFSACSLFTTDLDKKYSADAKVMTMSNSNIAVSCQDVYRAYLQWGYQYASYYSSSEDLLEYIATAVLNDKITEQASLEQFGALTDAEEALALKQAYDSMDETIRSYVYTALNLENKSDTTEDDSESVDEVYTPSVFVTEENGARVYTLNLADYADEEHVGALQLANYANYVPTVPGVASDKVARQAISKIVRNLQGFEKGFTKLKTPERDYLSSSKYFQYLTKAERAVLNREIDRMVQANRTTIAVSRMTVAYKLGFSNLNIEDDPKTEDDEVALAYQSAWHDYLNRGEDFQKWCDTINGNQGGDEKAAYFGCGRMIATSLAEKVIHLYTTTVANAIKRQNSLSSDSDLETSIVQSTGLTDVYYIPQDVANNLFTVSHILVGFTDAQKTKYQAILDESEKNASYNKEYELNKLYAETMSDGKDVYSIYNEVKTALDNASSVQEKYQLFRDFIKQYNSDPGMQNLDQLNSSSKPQYEYVMTTTDGVNKMVDAFNEASVALKNAGEKGAISQIVWSSYGAHIIMYTRDVSDFVFTVVGGVSQNYETLFATLTAYGNRTLFDTLLDANYTRDYSEQRTYKLNEYKSEHQVSVVKDYFKDFI